MTSKQKRSMFSRSTSIASSLLSSSGIEAAQNETTSAVVIGADTLVTPTVSEPEEKPSKGKLTDLEYDSLPRFTIRTLGCCGLMEVSGIQAYMATTDFRRILLGLYSSLKKQKEALNSHNKYLSQAAEAYTVSKTLENQIRYTQNQNNRDTSIMLYKHSLAGQFIFTYTQGHNDQFFDGFRKFVKENKLGEVYITPNYFYNPNSTRQVRTVLFSVENKNYLSFIYAHMTDNQWAFPTQ